MFLGAAGRGAEGNGAAYHMAGNSLIHLRRYQDAVTVYGHALRDSIYDRRGAVFANLGAAYAASRRVRRVGSGLRERARGTRLRDAVQGVPGDGRRAPRTRKRRRGGDRLSEGGARARQSRSWQGARQPRPVLHGARTAGRRGRGVPGGARVRRVQGRGKALSNLGQAYCALGDVRRGGQGLREGDSASRLHAVADRSGSVRRRACSQPASSPGRSSRAGRPARCRRSQLRTLPTAWEPDPADEPVVEPELPEPAAVRLALRRGGRA